MKALILVGAAAIAALSVVGCQPSSTQSVTAPEPAATPQPPPEKVTLAKFEQLEIGMSLAEVEEVLGGKGTELSRVAFEGAPETVVYQWEGDGLGSNMNATFQNDELIGKAQFGLK